MSLSFSRLPSRDGLPAYNLSASFSFLSANDSLSLVFRDGNYRFKLVEELLFNGSVATEGSYYFESSEHGYVDFTSKSVAFVTLLHVYVCLCVCECV